MKKERCNFFKTRKISKYLKHHGHLKEYIEKYAVRLMVMAGVCPNFAESCNHCSLFLCHLAVYREFIHSCRRLWIFLFWPLWRVVLLHFLFSSFSMQNYHFPIAVVSDSRFIEWIWLALNSRNGKIFSIFNNIIFFCNLQKSKPSQVLAFNSFNRMSRRCS